MKHQWHHPKAPENGRQYWRSLGELEESPEFRGWLEREFPQGARELEADDVSRRNFVKLMGASTALAGFGLTACSRPEELLVPFNDHVEWLIPGKALYYSSVTPRPDGRGADPLVVTTFGGRPTRVDGNKLHPQVSGGSDSFIQASILDLYDPDRSRSVLKDGKQVPSSEFDETLAALRENGGKDLSILVNAKASPTRERLLNELAAKGAKIYSYSPLSTGGREAAEAELFGEGARTVPNFSKAQRILSLDADFLGVDRVGVDPVREFTAGRKVDKGGVAKMNRLYVVEPAFSVTGGMADHRLRASSSQIVQIALLIASEIGDAGLKGALAPLIEKINPAIFDQDWIREAAKDLASAKGKALVVAGMGQPRIVHLIAAAINSSLAAPVRVVKSGTTPRGTIDELVGEMNDGGIKNLLLLTETDPVYDAPAALKFGEALDKVETVIHHGISVRQTAKLAKWHVPATHYLEGWGDATTETGVVSVQQPMLNPLFGGTSEIDLLQGLLEAPTDGKSTGMEAVKKTLALSDSEWNEALRNGFVKGSKFGGQKASQVAPAVITSAAADLKFADSPHPKALELILTPGHATYDGRFANNGWLQETPDPITKLTWDNAALISWHTAEVLKVTDGDVVDFTVGEQSIALPVLRNPGQADFTVCVAAGYYGEGVEIGAIADGVGFNVYPLRTDSSVSYVTGVSPTRTELEHKLATTADHYSMEGRAIVREATAEHFESEGYEAKLEGMDSHAPENTSFYKGPDYMNPDSEQNEMNQWAFTEGRNFRVDPHHQWAMTIDLHSCIGCTACTVACQSENNIPIVGKHQVLAGREMHWVRMDRYFSSPNDAKTVAQTGGVATDPTGGDGPGRRRVDDDNVEMLPQPVACQQCEAAPCEAVCPVNATVHSGDGLNAMTYNRCIGTRYCANNCPYKARRFNYFDYNKRPITESEWLPGSVPKLYEGPLAEPDGRATTALQLQKNPNVTVRMRGVIEKCTYCVQRLSDAKIMAKAAAGASDDIQVPANSVTTACQDACPADAITFGNLKAKGDRVNALKENKRNYDLLNYVGTRPRTSYLARIKNPNMKMPGASTVGTVTENMH